MARELREDLAILLHRYAWKESSYILKVLTREYGRISLVGRGLRAGRGQAAFLPCQPVTLQWQSGNDLGRLVSFAPLPPLRAAPVAERWWTAQYIGELVIHALPEQEPATTVFDQLITALDQLRDADLAPSAVARAFEWRLLEALGVAPDIRFDHVGEVLEPQGRYVCHRDAGLQRNDREGISGTDWSALQAGQLSAEQALSLRATVNAQLRLIVDLERLRTPVLWREARNLRERHGKSGEGPSASE